MKVSKIGKVLLVGCVAALTALALAGCGNSTGSASGSASASASAAGSASASASAASTEAVKVVIGTQNLTNFEAIALEEGYFQEAMPNAEIEVVNFSAGRDLNRAMAAGEIDFAIIGSLPVALGLASDIDYKVIYSTMILTESEALVAKNDSGIATINDLVGKKVATTFASTSHYSLLKALETAGVDPSQVEMLDMDPEKIQAAWARGDIDAAFTWDPAKSAIAANEGAVILTCGQVGEQGYPTADFAVVRTGFADEHPELVVAWLDAMMRAEGLWFDNHEEAVQVLAKHFQLEPESIDALMADNFVPGAEQLGADYLGGGFAQLLVDMSDFLLAQGEIKVGFDLAQAAEAVDASFMQQAVQD